MNIPFFNYPAVFEQRKSEYLSIVNDVLERGAFIMQKDLFAFEDNLAQYLDVKHVIGVADGTMAILMSLIAAGIGEGDDVIVPSHTFVASVAAIHNSGANPILVDCSKDHLIDPNSIKKSITPNTKAIMPVQLNGRISDMDSIIDIANNNNLVIIEDSCQALGAKYNNRFAGTFGVAGTFSFFPAKTLGCFGDGGAVITDNDNIAKKIIMLRDHGRDPIDGKVKIFGFNSRLDNLQAAILNLKLKYYDTDIKRRREIAALYNEQLEEIDSILLPPPPSSNSKYFDIFQNYEIEVERRDELRDFLSSKGIGTIIQWGGYAVHQFEDLNLIGEFDYTNEMTKRFLLLPMHQMLKNEEVIFICDQIKIFYGA
jgi:dTDP-4-amino-4,6-dideoxygalactose transaminase